MFSVLIIEDELLVRVGLKVSLMGSGLPVNVICDVGDGMEGYEIALEKKPHILITDLRLPGMDGLEIIWRLRDQGSLCKIIIISCLEDFETLRKAMSYQISHYLLKATMTATDLTEAMEQVIEELKHEASSLPPQQSKPEGKHRFISWQGITSPLPFCPQSMGAFHIPVSKGNRIFTTTAIEILKEKLSGEAAMMEKDDMIIVASESALHDQMKEAIRAFIRYLRSTSQLAVYGAWIPVEGQGGIHAGLMQLEKKIQDLCYFEVKYWSFGEMRVWSFEPLLEEITKMEAGAASIKKLSEAKSLAYQSLRDKMPVSITKGKEAYLSLLEEMASLLYGEGQDTAIRTMRVKPTAQAAMAELLGIHHRQGHQAKSAFRPEIEEVIRYVSKNPEKSLSLQQMAERVKLSTNYFSNLFTQEMGISYISYLNNARLDKSKSLLLESNLSVQEIAGLCGFQDENYFCRLFRQKNGISPGRWRTRERRKKNA